MLTLNYITINFYYDPNNNGLSTIVLVGNWEGGWLIIPQLNIVIKLVKGQVVMLQSSILIHENIHTEGIRLEWFFFHIIILLNIKYFILFFLLNFL